MKAVKEIANAKINLYLDVIARREDGFHDIKTVMHSVSLHDELTVVYKPSNTTNIRLRLRGNRFLPTDDKNLAVRAAALYLETLKRTADIEITLKKKIPIAAGLAGGSSDAAATLRAMNRLFDKAFTERALYNMASTLGSDVPYCLYGKTALCEGRGEILTKLPDTLKLNVVVAVANEHVSTPRAYTALDDMYSSFDGSVSTGGEEFYDSFIDLLTHGKPLTCELFNVFEKAVFKTCPGALKIKKRLAELGADTTLMSGSGPSVFGVFESEKKARAACEALRAEKIIAYFAKSV